MEKRILLVASLLGALTIALGAFGAHGLKSMVDQNWVDTFNTGVRYQMYHVLALLWLGSTGRVGMATKQWVGRMWLVGILFFSGSLYAMTLLEAAGDSLSFIGPITPFGGLLLILGWVRLAMGISRNKM